jgi:hypothetical protein
MSNFDLPQSIDAEKDIRPVGSPAFLAEEEEMPSWFSQLLAFVSIPYVLGTLACGGLLSLFSFFCYMLSILSQWF